MAEKVIVGVGKELSAEELRMLETGHSFLEIDSRYSSFKIVRKEDGAPFFVPESERVPWRAGIYAQEAN